MKNKVKTLSNNSEILPILQETEFQEKKILSLDIMLKYQYFSKRKYLDLEDCGRVLKFGLYEHRQTKEREKHLEEMYTCKDRFCPFCNWRRARKLAIQCYDVLKAIESKNKVRYLFVTFTIKNCEVSYLRDNIKLMQDSFARMSKTKRFKNSILGFVRALEIPPQKSNTDFIHPHFHCLFVVPAIYFNQRYDLYIRQDEFKDMWKKALRADYAPSVDVRVIKSNSDGDPIAKAVAETVKYPLKSIDLNNMSVDSFEILVNQMKNRRALAFGGIFKEYRKKMLLDDVENGDLICDGVKNDSVWEKIAELLYEFRRGKYGFNYYLKED